jgi:hypothetical protein
LLGVVALEFVEATAMSVALMDVMTPEVLVGVILEMKAALPAQSIPAASTATLPEPLAGSVYFR